MRSRLWVVSALAVGVVLCQMYAQAQQFVASRGPESRSPGTESISRNNEPTTADKTKAGGSSPASEAGAQLEALRKRKDALQKYLKTVSPASADYSATQRAIRDIDARLQALGSVVQASVPTGPAAPALKAAPRSEIRVTDSLSAADPFPAVKPEVVPATLPAPQTGEDTAFDRDCDEITRLFAADPDSVSLLERNVCATVVRIKNAKLGVPGAAPGDNTLTFTNDLGNIILFLLARKEMPDFLVEAEESRVDKQVGSTPGSSSGSTSLVVKGGVPSVLGFAVENGGLVESVNGTTITFRGNPIGIGNMLAGNGYLEPFDETKHALYKFLRKTSFAISYDVDRGDEPGTFTGKKQQLSAYSVRVEIINQRTPNRFKKEWEDFAANQAQSLALAFNTAAQAFTNLPTSPASFNDPDLQAWYVATKAAVDAASAGDVDVVFRENLAKIPVDNLSPASVAQLNNLARVLRLFLQGRTAILEEMNKGTLMTLEYTNNREVNAPDTSNLRFIYETGPAKKLDLTANASVTFFNKQPTTPGVNRIRDFQFAAQFDVPFGNPRKEGQFVFSFSGRYERLMEDATTQAGTVVPDTKGDIGVGQLKLTIPMTGFGMKGVKLPISLTFSNRTELIKEREVRANFGFTFDLDSVLAKFRP